MSAPSIPPAPLSSEDLHLLVESVQEYAIFMLDAEGYIKSWNKGAEAIKGYKPEEIIGKHFSIFYPEADLTAGKPAWELEVAARSGRVEDEGIRLRKDGSPFWASVVITALYDQRGSLRGFAKVTRDLSERRAVEESLRRSEERSRLMIEAVADYAIYMLDPDGNVTTWNAGAERIKGYSAREIVGQNYALFFPEADRRAGKPQRELEAARTTGAFKEEGFRVRKDGTQFWASVVLTPVRDLRGELLGFAKVTRDLSERLEAEKIAQDLRIEQAARRLAEQAEAKVRDSEERYRSLSRRLSVILEGVADGITVQDRSGRVIFANTAAARASGFASLDDFSAALPVDLEQRFELRDEAGAPLSFEELPGRRVLRGEPPAAQLIHVHDRLSGRKNWSFVRARAVPDAEGRPELAINIFHDVTESRRRDEHERYMAQATAALSESFDYNAMLSALASLLVPGFADWCAIYLLEGEQLQRVAVTHVDPQKVEFARELGEKFPPQRGRARGLWHVVETGRSELIPEISEALLESAAQSPEHLAILRSVGLHSAITVPIKVHDTVHGAISLVSAENGRRYDAQDLALAEELARRAGSAVLQAKLYLQTQEAAQKAAEAARRAENANRVKDEFLATVSHELRTPLNAILGWASVLSTRNLEGSTAKGVEVIQRNARSQAKIIEDILDVSRIITGKLHLELREADLVAIVRHALEVVLPSATARQLALEFAPPFATCPLIADPERLQQVVWNLLSNAVKFSDPGGTVRVLLERQAATVSLTVTDSGRGIESQFLPLVFNRFTQADGSVTRRVGGLGLGLAIVRHLVELHGGEVQAISEGLGRGSTFRVVLPQRALVSAPNAVEAPGVQPNETAPLSAGLGALVGRRVLVVDDEADARELLFTVLSQAGAEVKTAPSAAEGFREFQQFKPHILVSDIGMQEEDGYSFIRRVRALGQAQGGGLPSLALTAYARGQDKAKALSAGFTAHLAKPVLPDDLLAAITSLSTFAGG